MRKTRIENILHALHIIVIMELRLWDQENNKRYRKNNEISTLQNSLR